MISANAGSGITLVAADDNVVQGNRIGTDIGGITNLGNAGPGVSISFSEGNLIAGNTIAFNSFAVPGTGVVLDQGASNAIRGNSVYQNGGLGIDLSDDGVTLNDEGDADVGANGLLNFPVLEAATVADGNLTISGFARPGSEIELFLADADPTGFGEGQTFLVLRSEGSADDDDATTGTYGPGSINGLDQGTDTTNRFSFVIPIASLPETVAVGTMLTATATDASGNTSEFSGNVTVVSEAATMFDFGDAPDAADVSGSYPTLLASDGARHAIVENGPFIGTLGPDAEADGQPDADAMGDDNEGVDDEDALELPSNVLIPGDDVRLFLRQGTVGGVLNAWVDYNRDGDWDDLGEQIVTNLAVGDQGFIQSIDITVPDDAVSGTTYGRFRISTTADLGPNGAAPDGEVEDHLFVISPLDFGDVPDSYGTTFAVDGARHALVRGDGELGAAPFTLGQRVDAEIDGIPTANADGDDNDGDDDEDGITGLDQPLVQGSEHEIGISLTFPLNIPNAFLYGWIDFNQDGDFNDENEFVFSESVDASSTTAVFSIPADAVSGATARDSV